MTVSLDGQNIVVSGTATHTVADLVAAGSTNMIQRTITDGKTINSWQGIITVQAPAVLNFEKETFEFFRYDFSSLLGQLVVENGAVANFQNATILLTARAGNYSSDSRRFILRTNNGQINAYESTFLFQFAPSPTSTDVIEARFNTIQNCLFNSIDGNIYTFYVSKKSGDVQNLILNDVGFEVLSSSGNLSNVTSYRGIQSFLNFGADGYVLRNWQIVGSPVSDAYVPNDILTTFLDTNINLTNLQIYRRNSSYFGEYKKASSHNLKISDINGPVQNALVVYIGRTTASNTSDSSGVVSEFALVYQETNLVGMTTPSVGGEWAKPISIIDYSGYDREIRSYLHQPLAESLSIGVQIGSPSTPFDVRLTLDAGVTQTNTTTVAGYSGISHTSSSTTVSGTRTLAEAYDSRKLYYRNNGGLYASLVGVVADWGAIDLIISGTLSGSSKFRDGIKTGSGNILIASPSSLSNVKLETVSGTITLQAAGNYSAIFGIVGDSGSVVVAGNSNLTGWTGNGGATVESTIASVVTVDNTSDWVAGANVTLQSPQASVVAANFVDGVRVQVAHRQIFTISSTAINTTTDVITLGNDSNGDAANFRTTSPNTLIRFTLASGATIPTSSPQIFDGGLYYWKSGGQLSITEGGAAINFSDQGSGNFILIAETEKDNSVVSGGSGYSYALALSDGARVRVKAGYCSGNQASTFYDQVFAWSSSAGISILDIVSPSASPDTVYNRITFLGQIQLPVSGTQTPTTDGSLVTGLSIALEGNGKVQINANDSDGTILVQDIYAWGVYVRCTQVGIRLASSTSFFASDLFNYQIMNMELDNVGSIPLKIIGGRLTSSDGSTPIAASTSASIFPNVELIGTGAIVETNNPDITTIKKLLKNNHKIDDITKTLTIYDDNGSTPLVVYDLKDKDGNPATQQVYERRKQ